MFYYYETYIFAIISRAFKHSFNKLGGSIQIILDVLIFLYYWENKFQGGWGDFLFALMVSFIVFLFVFLINLIYEFRWAIPEIIFSTRSQLIENGKIILVVDVKNNEYEDLTGCEFKLNKITRRNIKSSFSEEKIPDYLNEIFLWYGKDEKIDIPSLGTKTIFIAKESPEDSLTHGENLFLGLYTNKKRILYPEKAEKNEVTVLSIDFEAELRGKLGERRIFPRKYYGHIIFKKHLGIESDIGKFKPSTWLEIKEIRNKQMGITAPINEI